MIRKNKRSAKPFWKGLLLSLGVLFLFFLTSCKPQIPEGSQPSGTQTSAETKQGTSSPRGFTPGAATEPVSQVFAVTTTKAVAGELINYLELNGDVLARSTVDIFPDIGGKVSKLFINVGDRIEKDQVIAEIDPSRPGMIFVPSPVRAPISGTVTSIPVHVGSTVSQAMPIARLTTKENLEIRTEVPERFIGSVRPGLEAFITFVAFPGEVFRGTVTELSPLVDPLSRTLEVKIRLTRQDPRIRPGMYAALRLITERKRGVVKVPVDALVRRFGGSFIFVVMDDPSASTGKRVERREVVPGIQIDEKVEILKGLKPGENIVVMGQSLLENQSVVRVVGEVPPLPVADTMP